MVYWCSGSLCPGGSGRSYFAVQPHPPVSSRLHTLSCALGRPASLCNRGISLCSFLCEPWSLPTSLPPNYSMRYPSGKFCNEGCCQDCNRKDLVGHLECNAPGSILMSQIPQACLLALGKEKSPVLLARTLTSPSLSHGINWDSFFNFFLVWVTINLPTPKSNPLNTLACLAVAHDSFRRLRVESAARYFVEDIANFLC